MTGPDPQAAFATHVSTLAASLDRIDYYKLLSAPRDATGDDIKRAWHRAAGIYHPDGHRVANEQVKKCLHTIMKRMSEAYRVLGDFDRRKRYDAQLAQGGSGRMLETKRESKAPRSPDAGIKNPAAKRCFMQAMQAIQKKDYQGAKLNLSMAQTYEGGNSQAVKEKLAAVDKLIQEAKAK